jgi:hypothetical protein
VSKSQRGQTAVQAVWRTLRRRPGKHSSLGLAQQAGSGALPMAIRMYHPGVNRKCLIAQCLGEAQGQPAGGRDLKKWCPSPPQSRRRGGFARSILKEALEPAEPVRRYERWSRRTSGLIDPLKALQLADRSVTTTTPRRYSEGSATLLISRSCFTGLPGRLRPSLLREIEKKALHVLAPDRATCQSRALSQRQRADG